MSSHEQGIERIRRLARRAEHRIRFGRALRAGAHTLCFALVVAVVDVVLRKVGVIGERAARTVLGLGVVTALSGVVIGWRRPLPARAGARALDRFHNLHDRLASAIAFAESPSAERTPFIDAAIEDAVAIIPAARPRLAVPISLPRTLAPAAGLALLLVAVVLFQPRIQVPVAHAKTVDPVEMSADDLEDVKDFLKQVEQSAPSADTKAEIDEFNALVDDIAKRRVDRTDAFRRMGVLEDKLLTGSQADKRALEDQLNRIGQEMEKAELTRPTGVALADHKLEQARDALHELAKKMRSAQEKPIEKAKLDQMRAALKKAAADAEQRRSELEQRRTELADEILKMKEKMADGGAQEEQSLLEKKQRDLERLDRDLDARKDASHRLDRLDRELEQAAEDLMKDFGLSAQDLDQG
ncbi:MAG: hypothetical protein M3O46_15455, partial [Myxococcota bacterium]|nr:hypothetical protein [Myxococcota bacterium]